MEFMNFVFFSCRYFNAEDHEARRYDEALVEYREANITSQQSLALLNGGQALLISFGVVAGTLVIAFSIYSINVHEAFVFASLAHTKFFSGRCLHTIEVPDGAMVISEFVSIQSCTFFTEFCPVILF